MKVRLIPESVRAKIVGLAYRCKNCKAEQKVEFDKDCPQPGESRAFACDACGAIHTETFGDPLAGVEDDLKDLEEE